MSLLKNLGESLNVEQSDVVSPFAKLALPEPLVKAIAKMGFTAPTPIQEKAIPLVLSGNDTISLAETGSGKTAAYLIPVIAQLIAQPEKQALILAPTRELVTQIGDVVRDLTHFCSEIRFTVVIGGAPMMKQVNNLQRNPRIIIATPGRLVDHIRHRSVNLKKISHFILDEADRMFDMGFAPQVNNIVREISPRRQTLLFSATFPNEVRSLAARVLNEPIEIEVRKNTLPPKVITQKMISVAAANKNDRTLDLINAATGSILVFTRTKHRTDRLARYLEEYGVAVTRIHGNRSQGQRNKSIAGFKSGLYRVMVATDIAARGLDVSDISDVINYDIPMTVEDYVHRIGRTGRAGQEGQALTLVSPEDVKDWNYIARKVGLLGPDDSQSHGHGQSRPNNQRPNNQRPNRFSSSRSQRSNESRPSKRRHSENGSERRDGFAKSSERRDGFAKRSEGRGGFANSRSRKSRGSFQPASR